MPMPAQTRESGFKTNPDYKILFEPSPRRVRVKFNGETIADSTNARLLFETRHRRCQGVANDVGPPFSRTRALTRRHCPAPHHILGEVTRFPGLGEVFWRAGPERQRVQIEAFLRLAASRGTLSVPDTRLAAEQFVSLVRGDIQLRHLLRLEAKARERQIQIAVEGAVDTFIRAFERSAEETGASRPAPEAQECVRPRGGVRAGP